MKYSLRSLFLAFFMSVAALAFAQTSIHLGYCSDEIPSNHQSAVLSDAISARFRAAAVIPAARLKALAGAKVTKIRVEFFHMNIC